MKKNPPIQDPISFGLEKEIKDNVKHYEKLKGIAKNGSSYVKNLIEKGDSKENIDKYKKVLNAYNIMEKFIDALHCKK